MVPIKILGSQFFDDTFKLNKNHKVVKMLEHEGCFEGICLEINLALA